MIRLKTHIGSKHKPGDIVADDALDAKLTARLIAEGRAERVKASDQTAAALRAAYHAMTAAMRSRLRQLDQAVERASADELENVLTTQLAETLETGRARDDGGESPISLSGALDEALEAHRQALALDGTAEAEAAAKAKQDAPPAKGGKKTPKPKSPSAAAKRSSKAAGGRGKSDGQAQPSTSPTDQKRSGAEAARGTHNPEAAGSNPASATNPEPKADKS